MTDHGLTPRGNALTPEMELTAPNGVEWIAYIEGVPAQPAGRLLRRTVLPGRRLRFDSADESRLSPELPAGSPFLREPRLLALLLASRPLPEPEPAVVATEPWRKRWMRYRDDLRSLARRAGEAAHAFALAVEAFAHGHRVRF